MTPEISDIRGLEPLDLSMSFRGTELLTIQYLLEGQNSQYGFKFELIGLNKADFSGSRDEQMLDTNIVKEAEQTGDLRKVTFYITHEDSPGNTRAVQLNFYEDGHVTSSSEVTPAEFDRFINAIHRTKELSEFLKPLDDLLEDYLYEMELDAERELERNRVTDEFEDLLQSELGTSSSDVIESYMYNMVIANIGIKLYELALTNETDISGHEIPEGWSGNLQRFFKTYAQYNIPRAGSEEYKFVASKLNQIIKDWSDKTKREDEIGAIGLLEYFADQYDLKS